MTDRLASFHAEYVLLLTARCHRLVTPHIPGDKLDCRRNVLVNSFISMKGFKSSEGRLARLFWKNRERWKQNAASKQKKIRAYEVKVRDLSISRDSWRTKAKNAQEEARQLKIDLSELKKTTKVITRVTRVNMLA